MKNKLPFDFSWSLLVPLAERTAALLGEPFGELTEETVRTGSKDHSWETTTWKDNRGHRVRLVDEYTREYFGAGEHDYSARIEGLPGVTIEFRPSSREDEVIGPEDAGRAAIHAWMRAMLERVNEWKMETGGLRDVPPEWEPRARALLRGVARARFEVAGRICAFEQDGEAARLGVQFDSRSSLSTSGSMTLSLIGPLPREAWYSEAVYFSARFNKGSPAPDMGVFVGRVLPANTWWRHRQWERYYPPPSSGELSFRVQHDEGLGPAAFVNWEHGKIAALFVGSEHEVRAALHRLGGWLEPLGWMRTEPWPTDFI